ncbi:MAG TPA: rhodanese-related sulfurtransferase [Ignavibacteriaceae bacterium]|nr:rhodanese-related sulfurtransferase [Ignavibacteriaceae bacterium]
MQRFLLLSFYKYIFIEEPKIIAEKMLSFCLGEQLKGKVYIAAEGINGNISGPAGSAEKFKAFLTEYELFKNIVFKEDQTGNFVYSRMHVRLKRELVNSSISFFNEKEKAISSGKRLNPAELLNFYENKKDFIIVDVRNWYESKIGKFRNALTPHIKNFREWPDAVRHLNEYKNKPVVTYCTGGIRCEKASAYLLKEGFKEVYQLDGGIISYVKNFPDTYWQGGVFVFDDRKVIEPNAREDLKYTARCSLCGAPSAYYINCHNLDCDKIFVVCPGCKHKYDYCCSEECMKAANRRDRYYE